MKLYGELYQSKFDQMCEELINEDADLYAEKI